MSITPHTNTGSMLCGRWRMYGIYSNNCPTDYAGKQFVWDFTLQHKGSGEFYGSQLQNLSASAVHIDGHLNDERIIFSVENSEFPQGIICKGNWQHTTRQFAGTWRTSRTDDYSSRLEGNWILDNANALPLFTADNNKFNIHYKPEHLQDIFTDTYEAMQDGRMRYQAFATLSIILAAVSVLARFLIGNNPSLFINIITSLLIFSSIISFSLFISQYLWKRKWMKNINQQIHQLCDEPSIELTIDNDHLIWHTSSYQQQWNWRDMTIHFLSDAAMIIGTEEQILIIPKVSMSPTHFEQLKCIVQQRLIDQDERVDNGELTVES